LCGGFARKGEGCGEKQQWLTGAPRVQPSIIGAKLRAEKRKRFFLSLATPTKNFPHREFFVSKQ